MTKKPRSKSMDGSYLEDKALPDPTSRVIRGIHVSGEVPSLAIVDTLKCRDLLFPDLGLFGYQSFGGVVSVWTGFMSCYGCGLWVLMHSLSVRVEDGESQFAFITICDFVHNFFVCEECRRHFYEMCSRTSDPFTKTRDLALWLWDAHNKVNARLIKVEESLNTADPNFPKMIWPPNQLCSSCYRSSSQNNNEPDWDKDAVFEFLSSYYGKTLVSLYKDKDALGNDRKSRVAEELAVSSSAGLVPMGAALAIAVASCAFGALACYWRSHQKSRKPRRNLS